MVVRLVMVVDGVEDVDDAYFPLIQVESTSQGFLMIMGRSLVDLIKLNRDKFVCRVGVDWKKGKEVGFDGRV